MNERDRSNALLQLLHNAAQRRIRDGRRLQVEKAANHGQIVLHAVMYLAQQRLLVPKRWTQRRCGVPLRSDVAADRGPDQDLTALVAQITHTVVHPHGVASEEMTKADLRGAVALLNDARKELRFDERQIFGEEEVTD